MIEDRTDFAVFDILPLGSMKTVTASAADTNSSIRAKLLSFSVFFISFFAAVFSTGFAYGFRPAAFPPFFAVFFPAAFPPGRFLSAAERLLFYEQHERDTYYKNNGIKAQNSRVKREYAVQRVDKPGYFFQLHNICGKG